MTFSLFAHNFFADKNNKKRPRWDVSLTGSFCTHTNTDTWQKSSWVTYSFLSGCIVRKPNIHHQFYLRISPN